MAPKMVDPDNKKEKEKNKSTAFPVTKPTRASALSAQRVSERNVNNGKKGKFNDECSFHPAITKRGQQSNEGEDPFDRLYGAAVDLINKKGADVANCKMQETVQAKALANSEKMSPKSKKLMQQAESEGKAKKLEERTLEYARHRKDLDEKRKEEEQEYLKKNCPFAPAISEKAKAMVDRDVYEANANFLKTKEDKIAECRKAKQEAIGKTCTFTPVGVGEFRPQEWTNLAQQARNVAKHVKGGRVKNLDLMASLREKPIPAGPRQVPRDPATARWRAYVRGLPLPGLPHTEIMEILGNSNSYYTRRAADDFTIIDKSEMAKIMLVNSKEVFTDDQKSSKGSVESSDSDAESVRTEGGTLVEKKKKKKKEDGAESEAESNKNDEDGDGTEKKKKKKKKKDGEESGVESGVESGKEGKDGEKKKKKKNKDEGEDGVKIREAKAVETPAYIYDADKDVKAVEIKKARRIKQALNQQTRNERLSERRAKALEHREVVLQKMQQAKASRGMSGGRTENPWEDMIRSPFGSSVKGFRAQPEPSSFDEKLTYNMAVGLRSPKGLGMYNLRAEPDSRVARLGILCPAAEDTNDKLLNLMEEDPRFADSVKKQMIDEGEGGNPVYCPPTRGRHVFSDRQKKEYDVIWGKKPDNLNLKFKQHRQYNADQIVSPQGLEATTSRKKHSSPTKDWMFDFLKEQGLHDGAAELPPAVYEQEGIEMMKQTWLPPGYISPRAMISASTVPLRPVRKWKDRQAVTFGDMLRHVKRDGSDIEFKNTNFPVIMGGRKLGDRVTDWKKDANKRYRALVVANDERARSLSRHLPYPVSGSDHEGPRSRSADPSIRERQAAVDAAVRIKKAKEEADRGIVPGTFGKSKQREDNFVGRHVKEDMKDKEAGASKETREERRERKKGEAGEGEEGEVLEEGKEEGKEEGAEGGEKPAEGAEGETKES